MSPFRRNHKEGIGPLAPFVESQGAEKSLPWPSSQDILQFREKTARKQWLDPKIGLGGEGSEALDMLKNRALSGRPRSFTFHRLWGGRRGKDRWKAATLKWGGFRIPCRAWQSLPGGKESYYSKESCGVCQVGTPLLRTVVACKKKSPMPISILSVKYNE